MFDAASGDLVYLLTGLLIAMVLLVLQLTYKFREEKKKNSILSRLTSNPDVLVRDFLVTQFNRTKAHNRLAEDAQNKLRREVVQLRAAYLKIEEKALSHSAETPLYWQHLNEHLLKLIKIIFPGELAKTGEVAALENKISLLKDRIHNIPGAPGNEKVERHRARAIASLEKLQARHLSGSHDKQALNTQMNKLESLLSVFESPASRKRYLLNKRKQQFIDSSDRHIEQLGDLSQASEGHAARLAESFSSSEALNSDLTNFRQENQRLLDQVDRLKHELSAVRSGMPQSNQLSAFINLEKPSRDLDAFDDANEALIASSEAEVERLRNVIADQRQSIIDMESSLHSLEQHELSEVSDRQSEIDRLKLCIRDSELCIDMLERELDKLRNELSDLRQHGGDGELTAGESEAFADELKTLRDEIEQSQNQIHELESLYSFVREALSASSVEDVSLLIYEALLDMNYKPKLLIKTADRTLEVCPGGSVSTREKVLVNSMQIDEVNCDRGGQLSFRFLHIAGILEPGEDAASRDSQQLAVKTLKLTDRIAGLFAEAHRSRQFGKLRGDTINAIKQLYYGLDQLIEEQDNKLQKITAQNFRQMLDVLRARGMSATDVATLQRIQRETLQQIRAASTLRLKSRKDFVKLIKSLENQA